MNEKLGKVSTKTIPFYFLQKQLTFQFSMLFVCFSIFFKLLVVDITSNKHKCSLLSQNYKKIYIFCYCSSEMATASIQAL